MRAGGLRDQSWQEQLAALQASLMASTADWKVVIGHHPPRSNGHHNNTDELIQHLEPILQVTIGSESSFELPTLPSARPGSTAAWPLQGVHASPSCLRPFGCLCGLVLHAAC